jgi:predicted nuclease with TOPRIM domain
METHTTGWGAFQNMKQENIRLKSEIEILKEKNIKLKKRIKSLEQKIPTYKEKEICKQIKELINLT